MSGTAPELQYFLPEASAIPVNDGAVPDIHATGYFRLVGISKPRLTIIS